jgi:N6-L-threonylcarbamoyladenine synthase
VLVLGIETSCDESSAALVGDGSDVLSNVVASQVDLHRAYGGVVPEIAARAHVESIIPVLSEALGPLAGGPAKPDLVAVTVGPGLVGSLIVGISAAKALSWAWEVPFVAVNHLEAHAVAHLLEGGRLDFPFLALVVSGGHTLLAEVKAIDRMRIVGETLDDALGEAYDKVSKYLGLGYPGGPVIDALSRSGDAAAVRFPRPMMKSGDYNFSLSGLKTAVIRYVQKRSASGAAASDADIAASFQAAALEVVVAKTVDAALELDLDRVLAGGGVACNTALRDMLTRACLENGLELFIPDPALCTDNAAMVAALGFCRYAAGYEAGLDMDVYPNLRLGADIPGARKGQGHGS